MITDIEMHIEDRGKLWYTISWKQMEFMGKDEIISDNQISDIYHEQAYVILNKLVDAQIGNKQVKKETLIKYIKAKR